MTDAPYMDIYTNPTPFIPQIPRRQNWNFQ